MKFRFLTGDVNWLDYGAKWISPKQSNGDFDYWLVIELTNMDDASGYYVFDAANDDEETETGFDTREAAQAWIDALPPTDELWAAFEEGITDAIRADLATYSDDDYGIDSEA